MNVASFLAASLALASPMTSGLPPLDSGAREYELTLAGPSPRRRRARRTVDGLLPDRDAVSDEAQREALTAAQAKRSRRAARGW